jgi:hypothetical protein
MLSRLRPRKKVEVPAPTTANIAGRKLIADDTLARAKRIIKDHASEGATSSSAFIDGQLDPLAQIDTSKGEASASAVEVVNCDAFTVARKLIAEEPGAKGKTTVLNLASDEAPAGGWLISLSKTQVRAVTSTEVVVTLTNRGWHNRRKRSATLLRSTPR